MRKSILVILFLLVILVSGCGDIPETKSPEAKLAEQLRNMGMINSINQDIIIGNKKIVLKELSFDVGTLVIDYKVPEQLASLLIKISPDSKQSENVGKVTEFEPSSPRFPTAPGEKSVSFAHSLELVNQKIKMEVYIDGQKGEFYVDFPGDKIAALTKEVYFNEKGECVNDLKVATTKVVVGLNYIEVESRDFRKDIIVFDLRQRRVLKRSLGTSSGKNTIEVFEPIPIPRNNIKVRAIPEDKLITISY